MVEHRAKQMAGQKTRAETMVHEAKAEPTGPGTRAGPTEHGAKTEMAGPRTREKLTEHEARVETVGQRACRVQKWPLCSLWYRHGGMDCLRGCNRDHRKTCCLWENVYSTHTHTHTK